jgi:hypothetical protein
MEKKEGENLTIGCSTLSEQQKEILEVQKDNYHILRQTINGLNELNEFSAEIERSEIQTIDKFKTYKDLVLFNLNKIQFFNKIISIRKNNIDKSIKKYSQINLNEIQNLKILNEMYQITKDIDDIDLYDFNSSSRDTMNTAEFIVFIDNDNKYKIIKNRYPDDSIETKKILSLLNIN